MPMTPPRDFLGAARRIVLKVGSSLMVRDGALATDWLSSLAADIAQLREDGKDVLVVSSGAVALGRAALGFEHKRLSLSEKQAAAAAGQPHLMQAWSAAFAPHGMKVAQILITPDDTEDRSRYLNARSTLSALLECGVIPIINENDTTATAELRYGDNDRLAARLAVMMSADVLLMLSDIDGLYSANPRSDASANHVPLIEAITPQIESYAAGEGSGSALGSGGMATKLLAAKMAGAGGCHAAVLSGLAHHPLSALTQGAKSSWFVAGISPQAARKNFIAASLSVRGKVLIDDGAARALTEGKSLLPAGVKHISGDFTLGDAVDIEAPDGSIIARGLIAYSSEEAKKISGKHSRDIGSILGYDGKDTLIHRDDLVMLLRDDSSHHHRTRPTA